MFCFLLFGKRGNTFGRNTDSGEKVEVIGITSSSNTTELVVEGSVMASVVAFLSVGTRLD